MVVSGPFFDGAALEFYQHLLKRVILTIKQRNRIFIRKYFEAGIFTSFNLLVAMNFIIFWLVSFIHINII